VILLTPAGSSRSIAATAGSLTETESPLPVRGTQISDVVRKGEAELLTGWVAFLRQDDAGRGDLIRDDELREQCREFLALFSTAAGEAGADVRSAAWDAVRQMLAGITTSRMRQGFSPSEVATFVFSFKKPLFDLLRKTFGTDAGKLADELWAATEIVDGLGIYTTEVYQQSREEVINRQQQDVLELSTPVVKLWDGVLALPMIGTLDSARTQVVMESLLQRIVDTGAEIAILDITGVPTVDTQVAQHLLKTVTAARLMGADCIISGIRPQIAQTIVHLGVDLQDVITKATLADAFAIALSRRGLRVVRAPGLANRESAVGRQGPRADAQS
jgi:rsbT co-antagonist protein RsbR